MSEAMREYARTERGGVRWREVAAFGALGLALCAAYVLILVFAGISSRTIGLMGMLTPAIAAFVVVGRRAWRNGGLGGVARTTSMWPVRPVGRTLAWCLVGLFVLNIGAGLGVVLFGTGFGVIELDLQNFSMLRTALADAFPGQVAADGSGFPAPWPFLLWLLLQVAGVLPLIVLAFGEELGWRGYLVPALMPLGIGRMLLVSLTFWVVWHLPLIMYNTDYEGAGDVAGWFAMFVLGQAAPQVVVVTWLRLASRSVWPAVAWHASSSMIFMVTTILSEAGTPLGVGIDVGGQQLQLANIALAVIAVVLLATGQMKARQGDSAIPDAPAGVRAGSASSGPPEHEQSQHDQAGRNRR